MRPKPPAVRLPLPDRLPFALALRRRPRLRRALGLLLALGVAASVMATVQRAEAARAAWGATRRVVVATRDLPPGHVLDARDVRTVELPEAVATDGALGRVEEGRVLRSAVYEGEVLLRRRLADDGLVGVAALLPEGARAVAVPVEPGFAPPLAVGQHVDAVGVVAVDGAPEPVLLAARALVVAVGEHAVTIAVDPELVARVAAALASGTVTLALAG